MFNISLFNEHLYNLEVYPTLKHYVLSGIYHIKSRPVNHVLVIGRDINDNFVYGEGLDTAELALVGERLDFRLMPQLQSEAEADEVAASILADMRLETAYGVITLPPNCGVELYDVISIHDDLAYQEDASYRVIGIRLDYNVLTGNYLHRYLLCAV